jgi:hypothetical protein
LFFIGWEILHNANSPVFNPRNRLPHGPSSVMASSVGCERPKGRGAFSDRNLPIRERKNSLCALSASVLIQLFDEDSFFGPRDFAHHRSVLYAFCFEGSQQILSPFWRHANEQPS